MAVCYVSDLTYGKHHCRRSDMHILVPSFGGRVESMAPFVINMFILGIAYPLPCTSSHSTTAATQVGRLRGVAETLRANAEAAARAHREAQEHVAELSAALSAAREAERRERDAAASAADLLAAARRELQRLRDAPPPPPDPRLDELRKELTLLRTQNKCKFILFAEYIYYVDILTTVNRQMSHLD